MAEASLGDRVSQAGGVLVYAHEGGEQVVTIVERGDFLAEVPHPDGQGRHRIHASSADDLVSLVAEYVAGRPKAEPVAVESRP